MSGEEAVASGPAQPFESLAELRREHVRLMRAEHQDTDPQGLVEGIESFLLRARVTGQRIDGVAEREAAQGSIDYWLATLLTLSDPRAVSAVPVLLDPFDPSQAPDLGGCPTPFRGLGAFQEPHADQFFGREEEVASLADKVGSAQVVLVVGPSGSGKSSIVLAGLLPRMRKGALPHSKSWRYLPVITPGSDPLASLLSAVRPSRTDPRAWVARHRPKLEKSAAHFRTLVEELSPGEPVVLVVDQLEELFTLCESRATQERFAEALVQLRRRKTGHDRLMLVVREDFLDHVERVPALSPIAGNPDHRFSPPPLSARQLREVVERPAELVGLKFDDGIVDELIKEVAGDPAALPLLQFTLLKLWESRERNRITRETYRKVGPPREALKRTADELFSSATYEHQKTMERIFTHLVQPASGAEFVRRRVRREALTRIEAPYRVNWVLDRLVEAGLVRMTPGVEHDDDRFEVVHEALIRNWPRLEDWLRNERRRSEKQIQLENAARLWVESGRRSDYLLSGYALAEAERYAHDSPEIEALVRASRDKRRRWKRLAVWLGFALAVLTVLVIMFSLRAREAQLSQMSIVLKEREEAVRAREVAQEVARAARRDATATASDAAVALGELASQDSGGTQASKQAVSQAIQRIITEPTAGRKTIWPNGSTLRIRFLDGSPELHAKVREYAQEWTRYANLEFAFDSSAVNAEVRITFDQPVSWSFIGTQARDVPAEKPTMNLGLIGHLESESQIRRVILHEFGHALGLVHELQNPSATISWDTVATYRYFAMAYGYTEDMVRQNVLRKYDHSIGYTRAFDPQSIMNVFRIPPSLTKGQYDIRLSEELSESDKTVISNTYPHQVREANTDGAARSRP